MCNGYRRIRVQGHDRGIWVRIHSCHSPGCWSLMRKSSASSASSSNSPPTRAVLPCPMLLDMLLPCSSSCSCSCPCPCAKPAPPMPLPIPRSRRRAVRVARPGSAYLRAATKRTASRGPETDKRTAVSASAPPVPAMPAMPAVSVSAVYVPPAVPAKLSVSAVPAKISVSAVPAVPASTAAAAASVSRSWLQASRSIAPAKAPHRCSSATPMSSSRCGSATRNAPPTPV
mmetsp:Transcript_10441/g.23148  ORF Transcript_10441/g.23148 Transcript_10441/m.23148 type:complete len:229 (+) Transcript_10441:93-779(+)